MRPAPVVRRITALFALVVGASAVSAGAASAHTELDFTLPAEGTTVGQPVSEISVGFTEMVALVGNGFEVVDPQGNVLQPFVVTDDGAIFRLQLDPPLAGGPVVVNYTVTSLDGHVIEGSFAFTAAAEPPVATTQPPVTSAPATTLATAAPTTAPPTAPTITAAVMPAPSSTTPPVASTDDGDGGDGDATNTVLLVVLIAVVLGAGGFLLARARRQA